MSQAQVDSDIISLNADCWNLILDLTGMSVQEMLSTERTSKGWQRRVLDYLSHRRISVHGSKGEIKHHQNSLVLKDAHYSSFKRWIRRRGHLLRSFEKNCLNTQDIIEILRSNCPNLEVLKLRRLNKKLSPVNGTHFPRLQKLSFEYCDELTDECIAQFLASESLKKLTIKYNKRVTHRCLTNLKSKKLKCLELRHCRALKIPHLLSVTQLSDLTVLILEKVSRNRIRITDQVYLLVEKMPGLEHLDLSINEALGGYNAERCLAESNVFFESVCRLKKLRYLGASFEAYDQHLEAMAENFKELEALHVGCSQATQRGIDALCRQIGYRLTELNLSRCHISDDDVVACIYACPKLTWLDVSDCIALVFAIELVAAARREMRASSRLRLIVRYEDFIEEDEENVEDVIELRYCHQEYPVSFEDEDY